MRMSRRQLLGTIAGAPLLMSVAGAGPAAAAPEPFSFAAFGCMPYGEKALPKFDRLLRTVGRSGCAFAFHLGDIKSGSERCTDAGNADILARLDAAEIPIIYTPGDNEWTDCHRQGDDPLERLAALRSRFFVRPGESLGRRRLALEHQGARGYPENARFMQGGVVFTTLHVVGSNNNLSDDPRARAEFEARNEANIAWLDASFDLAVASNAPAMVFAWQAEVFVPAKPGQDNGFMALVERLADSARAFGRPVLVVHADGHKLMFRRLSDATGAERPYLYFLQVMGSADMHAVRIMVDPADPAIFSYRPLLVPENGPY